MHHTVRKVLVSAASVVAGKRQGFELKRSGGGLDIVSFGFRPPCFAACIEQCWWNSMCSGNVGRQQAKGAGAGKNMWAEFLPAGCI